MKISIMNEKNNPLMKRKELLIDIDHSGGATPAKAAIQIFLSKVLKKDAEHIDVRNIFSDHGKAKSRAKIFVWEEKRIAKEEVKEKKAEEKETEEKKEGEKKEAKVKEEAKKVKAEGGE